MARTERIKITGVRNVDVNSQLLLNLSESIQELTNLTRNLNDQVTKLDRRICYLEGVCFDDDGK